MGNSGMVIDFSYIWVARWAGDRNTWENTCPPARGADYYENANCLSIDLPHSVEWLVASLSALEALEALKMNGVKLIARG